MGVGKHVQCRGQGRQISRRQLHHSFTLLELLVALGVTAIMASLLLPALSQAKGQAKAARCRSNLGELGLALNLFASDFSVFPLGIGGFPESPEHKLLW